MSTPPNPGDSLSRRRKFLYILTLGALTALGPFTVDLYLPAFPALEESLGVSEAAVQLTLTGTTIGFALGQLVVGPLSDKFGRRLPLILATAVHITASLGAAQSTDIATLGFFRVLMGIGAAGGGVVAMAMVRDLFSGYAMVRMFSQDGPGERPGPDPRPGHRLPAAAADALARHLLVPGRLRDVRHHRGPLRDPGDPAAGNCAARPG